MSLIGNMIYQLNALELSIITFVAYLLFYSMYDKKEKKLIPNNLVRILMCSDGYDKSLVEMNKAISLSGLSIFAMAFFPIFRKEMRLLLWSASFQLSAHAIYSIYKYYGTKNIPHLTSFLNVNDQVWKKLSVVFGVLGQVTLMAGLSHYISFQNLSLFGLSCTMFHFYTMEIDHKMILRVRPFAYVIFPLAILGVFYGVVNF